MEAERYRGRLRDGQQLCLQRRVVRVEMVLYLPQLFLGIRILVHLLPTQYLRFGRNPIQLGTDLLPNSMTSSIIGSHDNSISLILSLLLTGRTIKQRVFGIEDIFYAFKGASNIVLDSPSAQCALSTPG